MKNFLKSLKIDKYIFLLAVLSVALMASVIRFGLRTYKVPEWDEQHYMRMATEFYRLIINNPSFNTPYEMLQIVPVRQPGYPLLILPFLLAFGLSKAYFWGIFTNGLLYIASIFGIYFISKNFLSKLASFLAVYIFTFYGWTLLYLHLTYSETAVSAFTIWTILFLIKSNYFRNKKYSLLFGLFLGIGLLMKWIIIVYVSGPILYVCFQIIKRRLFKNKRVLVYGLLSFFIALIMSFYPYFQNSYWVFQYFYGHRVGGPIWFILPADETNPLSSYSLTFYLNSFNQLGIFYFILIISGFILALRKKSKLKPILFVVIISYIFSVLALLKSERLIIPIFPYLAILSASTFDYIKKKHLRALLIALTIVLSFGSFLGSTWGRGPMKQSLYSLPIELPFGQLNKIYLTTISRPPYIYKISGKEILDFVLKDSKSAGIKNPRILSLFYYRPLDEPLMTYNLYNLDNPLDINNYLGTVIINRDKDAGIFAQTAINNVDYILVKSGQKTDTYFPENNYKTLKALIILFNNNPYILDYYKAETKIWINQDSSEVTIFKKTKEIPSEELEKIKSKFIEILKSN